MARQKNALRDLSGVFEEIADAGDNEGVIAVFRRCLDGEAREGEFLMRVIALFNSAKDEIAFTTLDDEIKADHIDFLDKLSTQFAGGVLHSKVTALKTAINAPSAKHMLNMLADLVQSSGGKEYHELDRSSLVAATNDLIADVRKSNLPDYARDAMTLKLDALTHIVNASSVYPEDEIRLRIKSILADYLSEFEKLDDKYKKTTEKVIHWAKQFTTGGAFTLGLLADGRAVVGLLTGPGGTG